MLFNSLDFAIFLPIIFFVYWALSKKEITYQNILIVFASYFFYGWWDWKFLGLIALSTVVDFFVAKEIFKSQNQKRRKILLLISIVFNLGTLVFFKYFNFFIDNFNEVFSLFGNKTSVSSLNIILPVGISFYTFQTLSYTIDVYRKQMKPTNDFVSFTAFVSFFPQLVAGPIERASNLLPQFFAVRKFNYSKIIDGLRQILWGLFKKVVIADNCAQIANDIFSNYGSESGSTLFMGAIFFTFQIYGDFSGYSDIAIGLAKLFGFDLKKNFAFPYFSRDIAEFWRRWHISLSTWFRDYLYIPLGGSKGGLKIKIRNTFIIFIVSGFWHGANWTFVFWGFLNALYFLPLLLSNKNRKNTGEVAHGKALPSSREALSILGTFLLTVIAWVFFRSDTLGDAFCYIGGIVHPSFFTVPDIEMKSIGLFLSFFIILEWIGRADEFAIEKFGLGWSKTMRFIFYYALILAIWLFAGLEQDFIYFQF